MILRNLLNLEKTKTEQDEKKSQPTQELKLSPLLREAKVTAEIQASYLETTDLINVSRVSHDSHTLFSKPLAVKTLLQTVVYGDYKKAKDIISKHPQLLLERGTVKDYSGRVHANRTALQLALGACDRNVNDAKGQIVVEGIIEMIEQHFSQLPGKKPEEIKQIMDEQYAGQFPEGYEKEEAKQVTNDHVALQSMMKAIADAKPEDCTSVTAVEDELFKMLHNDKTSKGQELQQIIETTEDKNKSSPAFKSAIKEWDKLNETKNIVQSVLKANSGNFEKAFNKLTDHIMKHHLIKTNFINWDLLKALYQFRNHLEPKDVQVSGKHFNHQLLAEVARLYDEKYPGFGDRWDNPKNLFCWQKIFAYVERFVPACDAQCIAQGLWCILENGDKSRRAFEFSYNGCKYFPLALDPLREIGHNYGLVALRGDRERHLLVKLMSSKKQPHQGLCNSQISHRRSGI